MTDTCMQRRLSPHEAGLGGFPVWVPVADKKKEIQLVAGGAHTPPSVVACACAHIILDVQKLISFILSGFSF